MKELKLEEMSNSEIKIKMLEYENEYNVIKTKITTLFNRMSELDNLYDKANAEITKRNGRKQ